MKAPNSVFTFHYAKQVCSSRGLLRGRENFADGSFGALLKSYTISERVVTTVRVDGEQFRLGGGGAQAGAADHGHDGQRPVCQVGRYLTSRYISSRYITSGYLVGRYVSVHKGSR